MNRTITKVLHSKLNINDFNKQITTLLLLLFIGISSLSAQSFSSRGKDFWFSYLKIDAVSQSPTLYITSEFNTSGTISLPLQGWSTTFTVVAGTITTVNIPTPGTKIPSIPESIENVGFHITANEEISVFAAMNRTGRRTDATLVIPSKILGTNYQVMTYKGGEFIGGNTEFVVLGTIDNTTINIVPSEATTSGISAGSTISITLNAGETYMVQNSAIGGDLTGSIITSADVTKPFAVFSGVEQVYLGCGNPGNLLYEQIYPTTTWALRYPIIPFKYHDFDIFKVITSRPNTNVYHNGVFIQTISPGDITEISTNTPGFITADKPISVGHFTKGVNCNGTKSIFTSPPSGRGDPTFIILNSIEQKINKATFTSPDQFSFIDSHYVMIFTKTTDIPLITLDGVGIASMFQSVLSDPLYSYARFPVTSGSHTIIDNGCGFIAYAYGEAFANAYGYSAGVNLRPFSSDIQITNISNPSGSTDTACVKNLMNFAGLYDDSTVSSWEWDFGDGAKDTGVSTQHTYASSGNYTIILKMKSACLDSILIFKDITIGSIIATNKFNLSASCKPLIVFFEDTSLSNFDSIINWNWNFGDGNTSSIKNPSHIYGNDGIFNASLIIFGRHCTDTLLFPITINTPQQTLDLGPDTTICSFIGDQFIINPNVPLGKNHLWSTQDTTQTISVGVSGLYVVQLQNGVCTEKDSIIVKFGEEVNIDIPDTILCEELISINAGSGFLNYYWSTGENTQTITLQETGDYSLTVSNENCSVTDNFKIGSCKSIYIPNAFSPNSNNENDEFKVLVKGAKRVHLRIFNRWGELVFESTDLNKGWNGHINGKPTTDAVFVYSAEVEFWNGELETLYGNVMLLN